MTDEFKFLSDYDSDQFGTFVLKRDHTVLFWNKIMEDWSNIPADKIFQDKIFLFYKNLDNSLIQELFESIFKSAVDLTLPYPKYQHLIPCKNENNELMKHIIKVKAVRSDNYNDIFYFFYLEKVND